MALQIKQGFEYQGDDKWRWWIWLDGPQAELDAVDYVVYTLHRTFVNPVRTVTDRNSQFRLETSGWGEFRIYAKVVTKDGDSSRLIHDLVLFRSPK